MPRQRRPEHENPRGAAHEAAPRHPRPARFRGIRQGPSREEDAPSLTCWLDTAPRRGLRCLRPERVAHGIRALPPRKGGLRKTGHQTVPLPRSRSGTASRRIDGRHTGPDHGSHRNQTPTTPAQPTTHTPEATGHWGRNSLNLGPWCGLPTPGAHPAVPVTHLPPEWPIGDPVVANLRHEVEAR